MVPLLYMNTGRNTQMHSQTHSHTDIYITHNDTDKHRHMETHKQTHKHTQRHIKTCIASQRHTSTHRDTYKHTYKQTDKHINTQTTHGFIILRPSEKGSDHGPKRSKRSVQLGEGCIHCIVRRGAWLEDSTVWWTEDQGEFLQPEQRYKMTNCPEVSGTKEVLSTDKCQFKNRESPEQMGRLVS